MVEGYGAGIGRGENTQTAWIRVDECEHTGVGGCVAGAGRGEIARMRVDECEHPGRAQERMAAWTRVHCKET